MDCISRSLLMYGLCCTVLGRGALGKAVSEINLLSGSSSIEGVVEYRSDGSTGLICDQDWNHLDAEVVCRQLGYQQGQSEKHVSLGPLSGFIWNRDFRCNGTEDYLEDCAFTNGTRQDPHICPLDHIAQVSCGPPHDFDIRLAGSEFTEQGRLEVFLNGEWGSVTDGGSIDEVTLGVVCRQLGFRDGPSFYSNGKGFEKGNGTILIDDLQCDMWTGPFFGALTTEISQCNVVLTNSSTTMRTHLDEIGIVCNPYESVANHPVRLVDERGEITVDYGRVEIYHDGEWRSICLKNNQQFYYQICLELDPEWSFVGDILNLTSYNLSTQSKETWFELLSCLGTERLYQCDHGAWGHISQCPEQNIAGVSCIRASTTSEPISNFPPILGPEPWVYVLAIFAIITVLFFVILCCWRCYKGIQSHIRASAGGYPSSANMVEVTTVCPTSSDPISDVSSPAPGYQWTSTTNNDLPPSYESVVAGSHPHVKSDGKETSNTVGGENGIGS